MVVIFLRQLSIASARYVVIHSLIFAVAFVHIKLVVMWCKPCSASASCMSVTSLIYNVITPCTCIHVYITWRRLQERLDYSHIYITLCVFKLHWSLRSYFWARYFQVKWVNCILIGSHFLENIEPEKWLS